jgi:hypothetical protein
MPSEKGLDNFINLYQKKFGVILSRQEAFELLDNLIKIIKFTYEEKEN